MNGQLKVVLVGILITSFSNFGCQSDTIARGILLLAVYSAGLAVPFLLTALGIGQFLKFYQRFLPNPVFFICITKTENYYLFIKHIACVRMFWILY